MAHSEKIEGAEFDKLRVRNTRCYSCMIHCGSIIKIPSGKYAGAWSEGPEYETIWGFSGSVNDPDIGRIVAADYYCDNMGIDTISASVAVGFAYELYERGIISKSDTGGLELVYGNGNPALELVRQMVYREGFGDILADGVRQAARKIGKGAEQYAIQVKGLELPGYDPRGAKAHGLNLMTSNIGADHCMGYSSQEIFGVPVPRPVERLAVEFKGELTKINQDMTAFNETGILCSLNTANGMTPPDIFGRMLASSTGVKDFSDPAYLWLVGERIYNLERMFNVREGFGKKDDAFPKRFSQEPLPAGPSRGQIFEEGQLLADYYQARGWDPDTGIPSSKKLAELGLSFTLKK